MTISVIIPSLNEEKYIGMLLQRLKDQTLQAEEILVVDGDSSDNTRKIVRKFDNIRLLTTQKDIGLQRTLGGSTARSELLVFFDADVELKPDFLKSSVAEITQKKLVIACPVYIPLTEHFGVKFIFGVFNTIFKVSEKHFPAGAGPCIFVKKAIFDQSKGFRSRLLTDDLEFIHRIGKTHPFAILNSKIYVSDRRFKKYGVFKTFWQYLKISYFFMKGNLQKSNSLKYPFGAYNSIK